MWPNAQNVPLGSADPFQTKNLWVGASLTLTESATVWTRVFAPVPSVLVAPSDSLVIRYRPVGSTESGTSRNGVAILYITGEWEVRMPVTGAGPHTVSHQDMRFYGTPEAAASSAVGLGAINVAQINGTTQTALDLTGKYVPPTYTGVAAITVGASDTAVFSSSATRRYMMLLNASTANQYIGIWVGTATAVSGAGMFLVLPAGAGYVYGPLSEPPPVGAIRAWASAAGATLYASEGV